MTGIWMLETTDVLNLQKYMFKSHYLTNPIF